MTVFRLLAKKNTFVLRKKTYQTPCNLSYLPVGKTGLDISSNEYFSYLFFDLSEIPQDQVIKSAKLELYIIKSTLKYKAPEFLGIQALAEPFEDCYTNFQNKPPTIPKTLKEILIPKTHKNYGSIAIDITGIVKCWYAGKLINNGLVITPVASGTPGILIFHSSNSLNCSKRPVLTVTTERDNENCYEQKEAFYVSKTARYSSTQEVWHYSLYSFIIQNIGSQKILLILQNSPDKITFTDDGSEVELPPGQTRILVSSFFTRYNRIKFYLDPSEKGTGQIEIWLQAKV